MGWCIVVNLQHTDTALFQTFNDTKYNTNISKTEAGAFTLFYVSQRGNPASLKHLICPSADRKPTEWNFSQQSQTKRYLVYCHTGQRKSSHPSINPSADSTINQDIVRAPQITMLCAHTVFTVEITDTDMLTRDRCVVLCLDTWYCSDHWRDTATRLHLSTLHAYAQWNGLLWMI